MNKLQAMSEEEKLEFREKERERVRKAMKSKRDKELNQMTSDEINDFRKSEASRIRSIRTKNKVTKNKTTDNTAAIAMLKMTNSKRKTPCKTRQSFSKAVNRVRTELPTSPRKKAVVVESLAAEFGFDVKKNKNTN